MPNHLAGLLISAGTTYITEFKDKNKTVSTQFKNNSMWQQPSVTDSTYGANNFGVGIDVAEGVIPEFDLWKVKKVIKE